MAGAIDLDRIKTLRKQRHSWREIAQALGVKYATMYNHLYDHHPDILGRGRKSEDVAEGIFDVDEYRNWLVNEGDDVWKSFKNSVGNLPTFVK